MFLKRQNAVRKFYGISYEINVSLIYRSLNEFDLHLQPQRHFYCLFYLLLFLFILCVIVSCDLVLNCKLIHSIVCNASFVSVNIYCYS